VIAFSAKDENSLEPHNSTPVQYPADQYEVRKSAPRHGDSYIGGLDILTVHQMIEEQNRANDQPKNESA